MNFNSPAPATANGTYLDFTTYPETGAPAGNGYLNATSTSANTGGISGSTYPFYSPNLTFDLAIRPTFYWPDATSTRTITFTFDKPVNSVLLNIDRLGGYGGGTVLSNSAEFTLNTSGITMTRLAGTTNFYVNGNKFYRLANVSAASIGENNNLGTGTAAGTVALTSATPFKSISFSLKGLNYTGTTSSMDTFEILFEVCYTGYCFKPATSGTGIECPTKHGITALGRAGADNGNWPMVRNNSWTALESKTKGFVINRVAFSDADNNPATPDVPTGIPSSNFVEGMMVYDTTNHCLKIYVVDNVTPANSAWRCFSTAACPKSN